MEDARGSQAAIVQVGSKLWRNSRSVLRRSKCIYFEMDATAVDAAESDLVVWIVSRESQISDSAGWERLGSVCTPEKLLDLYANKAAGCGAKGFQMNIDAADEQGCRQVFLRVSAE